VEASAAAEVGGAGAAVAPYIGAATAVPHGGSNLPPWLTVGAALTAVAHILFFLHFLWFLHVSNYFAATVWDFGCLLFE
jgi:hypothetical protein